MRKAAAQRERRKTIARTVLHCQKARNRPPKLQTIADADTRAMPVRSAENPSTGKEFALLARRWTRADPNRERQKQQGDPWSAK